MSIDERPEDTEIAKRIEADVFGGGEQGEQTLPEQVNHRNGNVGNVGTVENVEPDLLDGVPCDPTAQPTTPVEPLAGFPFIPSGGGGVVISGQTGGGRSFLVLTGAYDGGKHGLRTLYAGGEVGLAESNSRLADIIARRGDELDDELLEACARIRYVDLAQVIAEASADPQRWIDGVIARYDVVGLDPAPSIETALAFTGDPNASWGAFYDRLIQPLVNAGVTVIVADNIGHDPDAKDRPRGASAKGAKADLAFSCSPSANPPGLRIKCTKARSIRAGIQRGDTWIFGRGDYRIEACQRAPESTTGTFRPTEIMAKISRLIANSPGLTESAIRSGVPKRAATVKLAIELLTGEGFIEQIDQGRTHHYYPLKEYTGDDERPIVRDRPTNVPDEPGAIVPVSLVVPKGLGNGTITGKGRQSASERPEQDAEIQKQVEEIRAGGK